jgi:hypothetical protein
VSVDDDEAQRLARFILAHTRPPARPRLLGSVRSLASGGRRR